MILFVFNFRISFQNIVGNYNFSLDSWFKTIQKNDQLKSSKYSNEEFNKYLILFRISKASQQVIFEYFNVMYELRFFCTVAKWSGNHPLIEFMTGKNLCLQYLIASPFLNFCKPKNCNVKLRG